MMSSPSVKKIGDLRGKRFGVGADGDYWAPIISNMLRMNGLRREEVTWVKDLDPVQKADMLLDGRIDVMFTSIQNYIGKLEGDSRVHVLAKGDELSKYRDKGPRGPSFVGVASDKILKEDGEAVLRVTKVLMAAARLFSVDQDAWVDAAARRRPDVSKESRSSGASSGTACDGVESARPALGYARSHRDVCPRIAHRPMCTRPVRMQGINEDARTPIRPSPEASQSEGRRHTLKYARPKAW